MYYPNSRIKAISLDFNPIEMAHDFDDINAIDHCRQMMVVQGRTIESLLLWVTARDNGLLRVFEVLMALGFDKIRPVCLRGRTPRWEIKASSRDGREVILTLVGSELRLPDPRNIDRTLARGSVSSPATFDQIAEALSKALRAS